MLETANSWVQFLGKNQDSMYFPTLRQNLEDAKNGLIQYPPTGAKNGKNHDRYKEIPDKSGGYG